MTSVLQIGLCATEGQCRECGGGRDVPGGEGKGGCGAPICRVSCVVFFVFLVGEFRTSKRFVDYTGTLPIRDGSGHVTDGSNGKPGTLQWAHADIAPLPPAVPPAARRSPGTWDSGIGVDCLALLGLLGVWEQGSGGALLANQSETWLLLFSFQAVVTGFRDQFIH